MNTIWLCIHIAKWSVLTETDTQIKAPTKKWLTALRASLKSGAFYCVTLCFRRCILFCYQPKDRENIIKEIRCFYWYKQVPAGENTFCILGQKG